MLPNPLWYWNIQVLPDLITLNLTLLPIDHFPVPLDAPYPSLPILHIQGFERSGLCSWMLLSPLSIQVHAPHPRCSSSVTLGFPLAQANGRFLVCVLDLSEASDPIENPFLLMWLLVQIFLLIFPSAPQMLHSWPPQLGFLLFFCFFSPLLWPFSFLKL